MVNGQACPERSRRACPERSRRIFSIWTVYAVSPTWYLARRFEYVPGKGEVEPTDDTVQAKDLELVRRSLTLRGLTCVPRSEADRREVVESWF